MQRLPYEIKATVGCYLPIDAFLRIAGTHREFLPLRTDTSAWRYLIIRDFGYSPESLDEITLPKWQCYSILHWRLTKNMEVGEHLTFKVKDILGDDWSRETLTEAYRLLLGRPGGESDFNELLFSACDLFLVSYIRQHSTHPRLLSCRLNTCFRSVVLGDHYMFDSPRTIRHQLETAKVVLDLPLLGDIELRTLKDIIQLESFDLLKLVIDHPKLDYRENTRFQQKILQWLVQGPIKSPQILNFLIDRDDWDISEGLHWACESGNTDLVRRLLASPRVDPNEEYDDTYTQRSPLTVACRNGNLDIVGVLLADPRTQTSDENYKSLRVALKHGHLEIARLLANRL